MKRKTLTTAGPALALLIPLAVASPAIADPTIGFGLSITFGAGQTHTAVGLRVFSDDRRDTVVASVGVDYSITTQSWRGTLGPAYLGDSAYISLDLGIGFSDGAIGVGIGVGGVKTTKPAAAPATPAAAPAAPPPAPPAAPVTPTVTPPATPAPPSGAVG